MPTCVNLPVPVMAAELKSVPWATAFDRLMVKVPLSAIALLVESDPVVLPLPSCSVPAVMVVALV